MGTQPRSRGLHAAALSGGRAKFNWGKNYCLLAITSSATLRGTIA